MKKNFRYLFASMVVGGVLGTAVWAQFQDKAPVRTAPPDASVKAQDVLHTPAITEPLNSTLQLGMDLLIFHDPAVALSDTTQAQAIQEYQNAQSDTDKQRAKSTLTASVANELNSRLEVTQKELDRIQLRLNDARKKLETRTNRKDEIIGRRVAELLGEVDVLAWNAHHPTLNTTFSSFLTPPTEQMASSRLESPADRLPELPNSNLTPQAQPVVKVYRLSGIDPTTAMDVLRSSFAGQPDLQMTLDPTTSNVIVRTTSSIHESIASMIKELRDAALGSPSLRDPNQAINAVTTKALPTLDNGFFATIDQYRNELIEAQVEVEISFKGLTKEEKGNRLLAIEKRVRTLELKHGSIEQSIAWQRGRLEREMGVAEAQLMLMEQQLQQVKQLVAKGAASAMELEEKKLLEVNQSSVCRAILGEMDRMKQLEADCHSLLAALKSEFEKIKE